MDRQEPRIIEPQERDALLAWLAEKWDGWRMPLLFLEVKSRVGCRISELAGLPTEGLVDGRLTFLAVSAKGRKTRRSKLPPSLYQELVDVAGPRFVFERFCDELRELHLRRGRPHLAKRLKTPFDPGCLVGWLQDRKVEFVKAAGIPRFKLHNFRGTAMSRRWKPGPTTAWRRSPSDAIPRQCGRTTSSSTRRRSATA